MPRGGPESLSARIVAKNDRGPSYCTGKVLIVFMDTPAGTYFPNRIARGLPNPLHFDQVWLVGLQEVKADGTYESMARRPMAMP